MTSANTHVRESRFLMKRFASLLFVLSCLAGALPAFGAGKASTAVSVKAPAGAAVDAVFPHVPQCDGVVLSQDFVDAVEAAKKDPRKAFEKKRREGVPNVNAATVECASSLWKAFQTPESKLARAERKASDRERLQEEEEEQEQLRQVVR